jgi:cytochrome c2
MRTLTKVGSIAVLFLAISSGIAALFLASSPTIQGSTLRVRALPSIDTQHFKLDIHEYSISDQRGEANNAKTIGGGAFIPHNGAIFYATSSGVFWEINPKSISLRKNILPSLDLGHSTFPRSKNITYRETFPRLCDITLSNGTFYVSYNKYHSGIDRVRFEIASLNPKEASPNWEVIYTSPFLDVPYYTIGDGGKLLVSDGYLYFTLGDYSLDRQNNLPSDFAAQNGALPWGKVNRLDLNDLRHSIYSLGHRNQQGLMKLNGGAMLATEHGPRGGDEINLIEPGKNYGWPYVSLGSLYGQFGQILPETQRAESSRNEFENPLYAFLPSVAPTQIIEITAFDPAWEGNLVMASLKAMSLYRIGLNGKNVKYIEPIYIGQRIRDIKQVAEVLFLLTDNGQFLEIRKNQQKAPDQLPNSLARCSVCHQPEDASHARFGPDLRSVWGRRVASTPFPGYSGALKEKQAAVWDERQLRLFLSKPNEFAPGTSMPDMLLSRAELDAIIKDLKKLR